jgi:hypothetical protein
MALHKDATEVHVIANWEPADATALAAISPADVNDEGKVAWQQDDDSLHLLIDWTGPTWQAIDAGGGDVSGPATSTDEAIARYNGAGGDTLQDSDVTISDIGVIASVVEDAVTNAFTELLQLTHNSSGTPAAGLGAAIEMLAETSTTEGVSIGQIAMEWAVITHASRQGRFRLLLDDAGTATEVFVITPSTSNSNAVANARGDGAVDIQTYRDDATKIASGNSAVIIGGENNIAAANASSILGGSYNETDSAGSGVTAQYSAVIGGNNAKTTIASQVANAGGYAVNAGDMQGTIQICVGDQVTHNTTNWYELFADYINDQLLIPSDSCWVFDILITGATSGMGKSFGFHILGMIENDGGTTTIKGTPTVTTIDDADDTSFDAQVSADDTNDALKIEVQDTDGASDVVRWIGTVRMAQLTYA